jgi:hypothetical protein
VKFLDHLVSRLPGSFGVRDGHGFSVGQTATLPTCEAKRRGEERRVEGGSGTGDRKVICEKDAAGSYFWRTTSTPEFDIRDCPGIDLTGATDNSTELRAWMTTIGAIGTRRRVLLTGGICGMSNDINNAPSGTTFVGDASFRFKLLAATAVFTITGDSDIHFRGVHFDGDRATVDDENARAISIATSDNVTAEDCDFEDFYGTAWLQLSSANCGVRDSRFHYCGYRVDINNLAAAVRFYADSNGGLIDIDDYQDTNHDNVFTGNRLWVDDPDTEFGGGLSINGQRGFLCADNHIHDRGSLAYKTSRDGLVSNNVIWRAVSNEIIEVRDSVIAGNVCTLASGAGWLILNCNGLSIVDQVSLNNSTEELGATVHDGGITFDNDTGLNDVDLETTANIQIINLVTGNADQVGTATQRYGIKVRASAVLDWDTVWVHDFVDRGNLTAKIGTATSYIYTPTAVRKNSAGSTFTRDRINFIEGSNVTLTVSDDSANHEVDVTIASSVSGASITVQEEDVTVGSVGATATLDFDGSDFALTDEGGGEVRVALAYGTGAGTPAEGNHTHLLAAGATDVTASASEVNILDGATLTVTELNYVDGVTSAIQTQLDGKVSDGGDTMTGDLIVPDDAYDATTWNGNFEVPTKNAIRDKIEAGLPATAGGSDTQVQFNDGGSALGGDAGLVYNKTTDTLTAGTNIGVNDGTVAGSMAAAGTVLNLGSTSGHSVLLLRAGAEQIRLAGTGVFVNNAQGATIDFTVKGDTDAALLVADVSADAVGVGVAAPVGHFDIKAGTTAKAPLVLLSGTNLTTPIAGAAEYDGSSLYWTNNTTSDRGVVPAYHEFLLTADGSAISTIADFFGATSSIDLPASSNWLLEADLFFLKTTNGTIVLTITNSAANYTGISGWYIVDAAAGLGTQAAPAKAGISEVTTAAAAFPATASLTNGTTHHMQVCAVIRMNAAGNIRLRFTASAGSATPQSNSWYSVRRLPGNTGAFVA